MQTLLKTTMAAALLAAGYYGREWQEVIDRSMANPIGPYEITVAPTYFLKTHRRLGRIWIADKESNWQWLEVARPKGALASQQQ
jgi:hypothetical protein